MTFAAELKKLMRQPPLLSLAAAESVTGGHLQAMLTSVSGSSEYFRGGITAYTLEAKVNCLGVIRAPARRANCVSQQVAVEMAMGACRLFDADLALATTGYAQPCAEHGVKVPMAWWALCHRQGGGSAVVISGHVEVPKANRVTVQHRVAETVIRELIVYLRELHGAKRRARRKRSQARRK